MSRCGRESRGCSRSSCRRCGASWTLPIIRRAPTRISRRRKNDLMPRLLLLLPTTTYRATAFVEAARQIGVELTVASERASTLESANPAGLLTIDFEQPD